MRPYDILLMHYMPAVRPALSLLFSTNACSIRPYEILVTLVLVDASRHTNGLCTCLAAGKRELKTCLQAARSRQGLAVPTASSLHMGTPVVEARLVRLVACMSTSHAAMRP